jgi:hypothetical protein
MDMVTNPPKLAGGILKLPMPLSRVVPCLTKRVLIWALAVLGIKVATKIGIIRNICLVSSTCVIEHNIHGLVEPVFTDALVRNLIPCKIK